MTLLVVLMLGAGFVLIISAIETDPSTGKSISVLKTIGDIWNDRVSFQQPAISSGNPGSSSSSSSSGSPAWTAPFGGSAPTLSSDAYRRAMVLAYVQSQR